MLKLMWKDGHAEWVPVTEQEDAERVEFLKAIDAIPEIPEAEKVLDYFPAGNLDSYGKRTMYQVEKFYADFYAEKDSEKAKVRRNRKNNRKHKAEELRSEKEKRKMRNIRTFGKSDFPEDHVRYIDVTYCGGGTKSWFGREEDPTIRMRKNKEAEQFAREDWELEQENHAQTMRMIHNLDAMAGGLVDMMDDLDVEEDDFMFMELNAEVNSYLSYSHQLWCEEEYFRKSKSIGVNPRDYLGITRRK